MPIIDRSIQNDITGENLKNVIYNDLSPYYYNGIDDKLEVLKQTVNEKIKTLEIKIVLELERHTDEIKKLNYMCDNLHTVIEQKDQEITLKKENIKSLSTWKRIKMFFNFIFKGEIYF